MAAPGTENVAADEPIVASEDFGVLGLDPHGIPAMMIWPDARDPSRFEPVPEPIIRTGMSAM